MSKEKAVYNIWLFSNADLYKKQFFCQKRIVNKEASTYYRRNIFSAPFNTLINSPIQAIFYTEQLLNKLKAPTPHVKEYLTKKNEHSFQSKCTDFLPLAVLPASWSSNAEIRNFQYKLIYCHIIKKKNIFKIQCFQHNIFAGMPLWQYKHRLGNIFK